jgi:co-chaperonin GroES (HSP10)
MRIRPIRGNLLVAPPEKQELSKGGIFIPDAHDPNAKGLTKGRIVDMDQDCNIRKYGFKKGMMVFFNKFSYTEVKVPSKNAGEVDQLLLLVNEDKIEACVDE